MSNIEKIKEFFKADRYAAMSGIEIISVDNGSSICKMEIKDMHLNAGDCVHGGAIYTLADYTFAIAANSLGKLTVSIGGTISYMNAGRCKTLIAKAVPLSVNRKIAFYEVTIFDETDKLIAKMSATGYSKDIEINL